MTEIKYPLSVIDGRKVELQDAFSWILHYFDPNKKNPNEITIVFDLTCSEMKMWKESDFEYFDVITNDINKEIEADYHICCSEAHRLPIKAHILIYDPPYVDLANRNDKKDREKLYAYEKMGTLEDLEELTRSTAMSAYGLMKNNDCRLIAKLTDFHYGKDQEIFGCYEYKQWFSGYFTLVDDVIYRFYKHIPCLGQYSKKIAMTHSHFMIFKPKKL